MFGYSDEKRPMMSGALAPLRSESTYANTTPLVGLVAAKEHLGLFSGGGTPVQDDSLDNVLTLIVGWATERVAEYLGGDVLLSNVTDYYPRLAARLALSATAEISQLQPLVLEYLAPGATSWTAVTGVTVDATATPPLLVLPAASVDLVLSDVHTYPVRARYTTHPYSAKGLDLIIGTVLALVDLRWQTRGQPPGTISDSSVRRILGANLS